jgi:hypothetical protein
MADAAAIATLIQQCGRVPLALRMAAELIRTRPDRPVANLAAELADERDRLSVLDGASDARSSVEAALSWSCRDLPAGTVRVLRLLGRHCRTTVDARTVGGIAGIGPGDARQLLDALVRARLVRATGVDCYELNELVRAYAASLGHSGQGSGSRTRPADTAVSGSRREHEQSTEASCRSVASCVPRPWMDRPAD